MTLGSYPEHDLDEARRRHVEARRLVLDGVNPAEQRRTDRETRRAEAEQATRTRLTVRELVDHWLRSPEAAGWAPTHERAVRSRLKVHVLDDPIADAAVVDVRPLDVKDWLARIRTRDVPHPKRAAAAVETRDRVDLAHRVRGYLRRAFDHAIADLDLIEANPVRDVKARLPKRPKQQAYGHSLNPATIGQLLRAPNSYGDDPALIYAMKLLPRLFCRPGELRLARWHEIDRDALLWRVPEERMKNRLPHLVPLAEPVLELLDELREYTDAGDDDYLVPSARSRTRPISPATIGAAYAQLGFKNDVVTAHGWRHVASTLTNEGIVVGGRRHTFRPDAIERQLAHVPEGVRGVYNAAEYLDERRELMTLWCAYLDGLETGGNVVAFAAPARNGAG